MVLAWDQKRAFSYHEVLPADFRTMVAELDRDFHDYWSVHSFGYRLVAFALSWAKGLSHELEAGPTVEPVMARMRIWVPIHTEAIDLAQVALDSLNSYATSATVRATVETFFGIRPHLSSPTTVSASDSAQFAYVKCLLIFPFALFISTLRV